MGILPQVFGVAGVVDLGEELMFWLVLGIVGSRKL